MSLSRRGSSPATSPRTGHWSRSSRSRLSNYLPSSGGIGGCKCNVFLKGHAFPGRSGFCLHRLWIWWCLFFCLTRRREKGQTMIHPQSETHGRLNNSNKAIFSLQKLLARADLKRLISYCTFQAPQKVVTIFYNNKKKPWHLHKVFPDNQMLRTRLRCGSRWGQRAVWKQVLQVFHNLVGAVRVVPPVLFFIASLPAVAGFRTKGDICLTFENSE